jgi:hypothetical protein
LQKLTITKVINAEEEDDNPLQVTTATASLTGRAGEEEPAMSLDQEGLKMGDLDLALREPPYIRW